MRKDIFTLERREARTLKNLRVGLTSRFAALAAGIALNHRLERPPPKPRLLARIMH
jgi:hypothetical protein